VAISGANKNAVAKLNVLFRDSVHYCDLSETPVRHTAFTAFTVAVSVSGRHFVGVGKTKKAARNAAAERALIAMRLWTDADELAKVAATMEVDDDPVEAVYRMRSVIARERERQSWDQGGWGRSPRPPPPPPPQWGHGEAFRGRGGWSGPGSGWGGDRFRLHHADEWDDEGPERRNWHRPARGTSFDRPRGSSFDRPRGRAGAPRGRGFLGDSAGPPFHRNSEDPNPGFRTSKDTDRWNRGGGHTPSGRGRQSAQMTPGHSSLLSGSTPPRFPSDTPPSSRQQPTPVVAGSNFPSASTMTPWNLSSDPSPGIFPTSSSQMQATAPAAPQAPGSYPLASDNFHMGGMSYANMASDMSSNSAAGFMQLGYSQQNAVGTDPLSFFGSYADPAYSSMYGYGNFGLY